ncbi:hypothetical protein FVA95_24795 [Pseudonocardia sp. EV170527-09]|uniref:hypothetical protein n=1 Tax=Pseudonocardia sp. EV170527-09 TaxID=2603411 RepID=UPI0011F39772|nr:hypothetical protein [Pseudonocardia sp. EV170527-09]KAA1017487.1 hypothetical protein FVA95_24795 [Pseudonocardia sp. EV170527-09]
MDADAGPVSDPVPDPPPESTPTPDPGLDVVTDLFSDDPDVARRRTVAAMVALSEQELSDYDRRAVASVLDGTFSDDDARRVAGRVQLADGYLTDPQVTAETDQQMTLLLLEKALRLTALRGWHVCWRGGGGGDTEQERMIAERRVILGSYATDDATATAVEKMTFDPRGVSVTYLATTRCTTDADTTGTGAAGADPSSADKIPADGGTGRTSGDAAGGGTAVLSPSGPQRRSWWRWFGRRRT